MLTTGTVPRALVVSGMVLALVGAAGGEVFTVVALPDTQHYTAEIGGGAKAMFDAGLFAIYANHDRSVLPFLPPLLLGDEEADEIVTRVKRALG